MTLCWPQRPDVLHREVSTPGFDDLLEDTWCGNVLISNRGIHVCLHEDLVGTECTSLHQVSDEKKYSERKSICANLRRNGSYCSLLKWLLEFSYVCQQGLISSDLVTTYWSISLGMCWNHHTLKIHVHEIVDTFRVSNEEQRAATLCPTSQRRWIPPSHSNKLWIVSGAGIFFFFFHRHQQTNWDGARRLSTAWGRTSSCEFPWPRSDSEWLKAAVKITGEVTKWHWERLEADKRKLKTKKLRAKAVYGVLKAILWYSKYAGVTRSL